MTTPVITPSTLKTWIGLFGSVLAFAVPLLVSVQNMLPEPWPAVIGGVIAVLTALGIYHAPYVKPNTVIVPADPPTYPGEPPGGYPDPYK